MTGCKPIQMKAMGFNEMIQSVKRKAEAAQRARIYGGEKMKHLTWMHIMCGAGVVALLWFLYVTFVC